MKQHKWKAVYIVLFFLIVLLPAVCMPAAGNTKAIENKELSEVPNLKDETGINWNYLKQLGEYFSEHMAFREELVTANAVIRGRIFGVSGADGVILGEDEWLYYKATLSDYLRQNTLTEREIFNIAHNVALMQQYVEERGKKFLFTVPPNKNTLYGDYMPYYYQMKTGNLSNLEKLVPMLEKEGVHYVDLLSLFQEQNEVLYHKRDSHWNNKGAILVYNALMDALGKEHETYQNVPYEVRNDFIGDLDKMLFPARTQPMKEQYYDDAFVYAYVGESKSTDDALVWTVNPSREDSLLMYRDSFGNSLLPFMANAFGSAYFSQITPYHMDDMEEYSADVVLVEKVERHLSLLGANPPIMEGVHADLSPYQETLRDTNSGTTFALSEQEDYWKIDGVIGENYREQDTRIFVRIEGKIWECFPVTVSQEGKIVDYGYRVYVPKSDVNLDNTPIEVMVKTQDTVTAVHMEVIP